MTKTEARQKLKNALAYAATARARHQHLCDQLSETAKSIANAAEKVERARWELRRLERR